MRGIETLFTYVKPIWEQLKKLFMTLWDVMCQLYELLKPVFDAIGALVVTCWAITSGIIEGAISALGPLIQAVLNVLQIVIDVVGAIVSLFRGDFSGAFEHVKNIGENFKNFFVNLWQGILNFGKGFVDGFVNLFKSLGIDIESIFKNVCNAIGTFFSNIWGGIKSVATGIWDTITNVFGGIGDWFANLWKTAFNWGKNLINSIGDGIKSAWNWVKDACSSVIGTIKGWLGFGSPTKEGPGRYADTWAPNLMEMYSEGIESSIPDIQSAVNDVADVLSNIDGGYKTNVSTGNTSISSDILNGLLTAMNTNRNINSESGKTIELSIDGTVFARLIYPALTKEFKRNGMLLKEGGFI
jgi:phage-related protein